MNPLCRKLGTNVPTPRRIWKGDGGMNRLFKIVLRLYKRLLESRIDFDHYDPKLSRKLDVVNSLLEA